MNGRAGIPWPGRRRTALLAAAAFVAIALGAGLVLLPPVAPPGATGAREVEPAQPSHDARLRPLPQSLPGDPDKIRLGKLLFQDQRLSGDGTVSCASCHDLAAGGHDGRRHAVGIRGQTGTLNTPTVWNSVFNFRQFWDGRGRNLVDQIDGPIENPIEMGTNWPDVVARLQKDRQLRAEFGEVYPEGITRESVKDAIAAFEGALITPNSRFDRYLRGEPSALTAEEREGFALFQSFGCDACHQGINIGGNMYQRVGILGEHPAGGPVAKSDLGRFNVTGEERDRYRFKVPSLRNVARTAPYFHDGSAATLEDAVRVMARYQVGLHPSEQEIGRITAFLHTLDGELRLP